MANKKKQTNAEATELTEENLDKVQGGIEPRKVISGTPTNDDTSFRVNLRQPGTTSG